MQGIIFLYALIIAGQTVFQFLAFRFTIIGYRRGGIREIIPFVREWIELHYASRKVYQVLLLGIAFAVCINVALIYLFPRYYIIIGGVILLLRMANAIHDYLEVYK